jgi:uncharacterized protein YndB with AHSA1/START domain
MKHQTKAERKSDRELVVTRTFNGPARLVFQAWTTPDLLKRWWAPKSIGSTLVSCEVDARTGGRYRFEFGHPSSDQTFAFFGKYLEVVEDARIVWTNEESDDGAISTLTLQEKDGRTLLTLSEIYPTKEACDEAMEGSAQGLPEQFGQLDELLVELAA